MNYNTVRPSAACILPKISVEKKLARALNRKRVEDTYQLKNVAAKMPTTWEIMFCKCPEQKKDLESLRATMLEKERLQAEILEEHARTEK